MNPLAEGHLHCSPTMPVNPTRIVPRSQSRTVSASPGIRPEKSSVDDAPPGGELTFRSIAIFRTNGEHAVSTLPVELRVLGPERFDELG